MDLNHHPSQTSGMTEALPAKTGATPTDPPAAQPSLTRRVVTTVWEFAAEHWFILGLAFSIGFAAALPDFGRTNGWIEGQYTIKYGAVIIIFFLSGIGLKTKVLLNALARIHFHFLVQSISLALTPAIGFGIARAVGKSPMNDNLVKGLIVCTSMPTTISTNVVFTKQAGGNEAAALVNAVFGNVVGIFVSPGWLYLYLGKASQAPYAKVCQQLGITVVAPLVVGQVVQFLFEKYVKMVQQYVNFGKVSNVMILLLVWATFCNTFHQKVHLDAGSIICMIILVLLLFFGFSILCLGLGTFAPVKKLFRLDKADAIALTMCGATKTLALGMPLISVLYGDSEVAGILALPLLIYHAEQILFGNLFIKPLKRWASDPQRIGAWPASCWTGPPDLEQRKDTLEVKAAPPSASPEAASESTDVEAGPAADRVGSVDELAGAKPHQV